jgi:nucleoside-triphosphatase THEP1
VGAIDMVATVHAFAHPFSDELKRRAGVEVVSVTAGNRDRLPERLTRRLAGRATIDQT